MTWNAAPAFRCVVGKQSKLVCQYSDSGNMKSVHSGTLGSMLSLNAPWRIVRVSVTALWTRLVRMKSFHMAVMSSPFLTANAVPGTLKTVPHDPIPMIRYSGVALEAFALARFMRSAKLNDVDTTDRTVNVLLSISRGASGKSNSESGLLVQPSSVSWDLGDGGGAVGAKFKALSISSDRVVEFDAAEISRPFFVAIASD